jgi:hypothetical protein
MAIELSILRGRQIGALMIHSGDPMQKDTGFTLRHHSGVRGFATQFLAGVDDDPPVLASARCAACAGPATLFHPTNHERMWNS